MGPVVKQIWGPEQRIAQNLKYRKMKEKFTYEIRFTQNMKCYYYFRNPRPWILGRGHAVTYFATVLKPAPNRYNVERTVAMFVFLHLKNSIFYVSVMPLCTRSHVLASVVLYCTIKLKPRKYFCAIAMLISGFRWEVEVNCALLGYYAASSGNFLPTFRDNLLLLSSGIKIWCER